MRYFPFLEKVVPAGLKKLGPTRNRKPKIRPMSLSLLKKIKQGLLKGGWKKITRTSVWVASLVAFWGSFRLGELLPHSQKTFDKFSDLLWKDVKIGEKKVTIHLKNPKISSGWGDHVTLFAVPCKLFCPVQWFKKLRAILGNNGLAEKTLPVFRIKGGGRSVPRDFLENCKISSGHDG